MSSLPKPDIARAGKDGSQSSSSHEDPAELLRRSMPSLNPLPLNAAHESQIREVYHARVKRKCATEIKAFSDCARGRTFSIPFACRPLHRAMNACMVAHATPEEEDLAREEWFARRFERQQDRERRQRRAREQEKFVKEWWWKHEPVPEHIDVQRAREFEEKMRRPEQVSRPRRKELDSASNFPSGITSVVLAKY